MNRKIITLLVFLNILVVGGIAVLAYTYFDNPKESSGSIISKKVLAKEFDDSYVKNITPNGNVIELDMVASEGEVEIFEDHKTKVWNYNSSVPGPEIKIKLGDTIRINFTNNLPQDTTIHFHGIRVPNAMDGVPGVTQDPIKPGDSYIYEFTPKDAGTFWFHPHVRTSEQMERGLYGTIVVEDEYINKYSQDIVWVIDDWSLKSDYQINPNFVTMHDLMHDGRWGNVITVNGSVNETLNTKPGERIRLRLVNSSNGRVYSLDFDGLEAKVIAVDGMYVKEVFNVNGFELAPGNRLDVDIKIPNNVNNKAFTIKDIFTRNTNRLAQIFVSGDVTYVSDFDYPINSKIPDWSQANDASVDQYYVLNAQRSSSGSIEWTMNGKAFPDHDGFTMKSGEFNKIRFVNNSSRIHPMHLHGQFFKVIARDGLPVNEEYFRDTVLVHSKETVDIGIIPLDEGRWVNHCHILEHADSGMMTIFNVE